MVQHSRSDSGSTVRRIFAPRSTPMFSASIVPSDTNDSIDMAYEFGRPVETYVSPRQHARLLVFLGHLNFANGEFSTNIREEADAC